MLGLVVAMGLLGLATGSCAKAQVGGEVDPDATAPEVDATSDGTDSGIDGIDAATCARSPCDILTQCGCEATPTPTVCDLDFQNLGTGATKCRADSLGGMESTTCSMTTTCEGGFVCVGGRCARYCDDDLDCPGDGGLCIIDLTQGTPAMPIPGAPSTCTTDCVPSSAANPTCPTTWACHLYQDDPSPTAGDERYLTNCDPPGAGAVNAVCTSNLSCQAGFDCINLGGTPANLRCRPNCLCPGGNCAAGLCPAGSGSCRAFTPPIVVGAMTYGTCI